MVTLRLGAVDMGATPSSIAGFLNPFHRGMAPVLRDKKKFRDEANFAWRAFSEVPGNHVQKVQQFLHDAGFFPNALMSGIFGYGTLSAVRLFQEYVYSIEKDTSIGTPDGIVGGKTWAHIDRWQRTGMECEWKFISLENPTETYLAWMDILRQAKSHYHEKPNRVLDQVRQYPAPSDTLPPEKWQFDPNQTHLVGIRRNPDLSTTVRANDDFFVLLIKGMAFAFWGSTDPNPRYSRSDEAFLVEGQHKYRFSWHKVSSEKKIYKALRPYAKGVLVFRDRTRANALTPENIRFGLDSPNMTINIHWSGDGDTNFSAGCQVIAGNCYFDHKGDLVDCSAYAASSYPGLAAGKTRGAYNLMTDLVIAYTPLGNDIVWYTLGREENLLEIAPVFGPDFLKTTIQQMRSIS